MTRRGVRVRPYCKEIVKEARSLHIQLTVYLLKTVIKMKSIQIWGYFVAVCVCFSVSFVLADDDEGEAALPELQIEVVEVPDDCGKKTQTGDFLKMHYAGRLEDGTEFDSSYYRERPFEFQLGTGQVIAGWDQGLIGMCVGEKRTLIIPAHLGYGEKGSGKKIPGGATLIFDVELLDFHDSPAPEKVFKEIDTDGDDQLSQEEFFKFLVMRNKELPIDEQEGEDELMAIAKEIFPQWDGDANGHINIDEFNADVHEEL